MRAWKVQKGKEKELAKKAAAELKKGRVLVCPTDTVYGLVADATNKKAVQEIFRIKGREEGKALPIFVGSLALAKKLARVSRRQETLMKEVWPGKVTFVLVSKGVLPAETGTKETIGLRAPKHRLVQELLRRTGKPLTGTSANLARESSLSDSGEIMLKFQGKKHAPDILLDADRLPRSRPSKVVDITREKPRILRK